MIVRLKEIAAHVLSTDNMRLVTRALIISNHQSQNSFSAYYFKILENLHVYWNASIDFSVQ